jgi:Domain of unknown function (DUF4406)/Domain of unknown function (DUF6378)
MTEAQIVFITNLIFDHHNLNRYSPTKEQVGARLSIRTAVRDHRCCASCLDDPDHNWKYCCCNLDKEIQKIMTHLNYPENDNDGKLFPLKEPENWASACPETLKNDQKLEEQNLEKFKIGGKEGPWMIDRPGYVLPLKIVGHDMFSSESWLADRPLNKEIVYISGPMTGIPDHNFPAFTAAAKKLREEGFHVFNPAENDNGSKDKSWEWYMSIDLANVCKADKVMVLPGWRKSRGATKEVDVALTVGVPVIDFETRELITDELVGDEAKRLVYGDRGDTYDHPADNFRRIARLWEGIKDIPFTEQDVALMMVCVKLAREAFNHKRDNLVDGIGYWLTLDRVYKRKEGKE